MDFRVLFEKLYALLAEGLIWLSGRTRPCIAADGTVTRSRAEMIVRNLLLLLRLAFL